jgi:hypothetical protein
MEAEESKSQDEKLATGALRRPRGIKTRSGTSLENAACRFANCRATASWIGLRTGMSRDSRRGLAQFNFETSKPPDPTENPGTWAKTSKTSARRRTRRSPMLAHETLPVSRASVVGMTYGACHVPSYLPAGIPGVSTARRQEDRLRPEGQLCQQPAGDSTVEGRSRAMKTKAHQQLFHRKWADPDKSNRGQGRE